MPSVEEAVALAMGAYNHGDLHGSAAIFDQILYQIDKPDPNVLIGYGSALIALEKYGIGITLLQTGLAHYPANPLGWCNLGVAYKHIGRDDLSLGAYQKAFALAPDMPEVLAGLAGYYINRNSASEAEKYARRAVEAAPDLPGARMNLGVALLEQGRFDEAWPYYESRWDSLDRINDRRPYKAPRWTGERVGTLAIHGEQGLGDEIMFMAAFERAKALAGRVIVECAPRLISLFSRSLDAKFYGTHAELIEAEGEPDAYIPMGSLFSVVGLPDGKPYLIPAKGPSSPARVGIAWRGGTNKTNINTRSIQLEQLRPILSVPGVEFVSVQYGPDDVDAEARANGLTLMPARDFDTIQATIESCDLIISVPQTAVHQAGAIGKDCWVLTPSSPSWPFAGEGKRMRFYNSVHLIRQANEGDWNPVIQSIAQGLRERYAAAA